MTDSLFSDYSYSIAKLALDGLSQRQMAISNNIANVDTPGYHAQTVDFKSVLKHVTNQNELIGMKTTNPLHLTSTTDNSVRFFETKRPDGTERADGNDVDIDVELTDMSETGIEYQAVSQAVSLKLQLLKAIAQSR
jgi:flagellar basal-body rod protein FlgB